MNNMIKIPAKINMVAPINQLGYGITGMNILKALSEVTEVALWPIGNPAVTSQQNANIVSEAITRSRMIDFDAPCIKVWHQNDMSQFAGRGTRIGFPIFELDAFNEHERHHLSSLDHILVCSEWAKRIILNEVDISQENVHVVPLGVDQSIFHIPPKEDSENTIFFNCGKWEVRKGHDILVTAFNLAFSEGDNVELWMMCENPFFSENEQSEWISLYKNSKLGKKIKMIGRAETQEEVYNIMSKTDCGVFPSRAEGWNLELLEMMACGKQVIATNCSAHTEFCNEENCVLIEPGTKEIAYDGKWFHGKCGEWASMGEQQIQDVANAMKMVYEAKPSPNKKGLETASHYSWKHSAKKILQVIENV